jgi:PAS domain-containing protein
MEVRVAVAGEMRWHAMYGMCFRENGKVVRWTGSATDVTERKRAEEALRVSEDRYARAIEGSDVGHWDCNLVTQEMFVSDRAREMLALSAGRCPRRGERSWPSCRCIPSIGPGWKNGSELRSLSALTSASIE